MKNEILKHLASNARKRLMGHESANIKQKNSVYSPNVKFKIISNEDTEFNRKASLLCEEDLVSPFGKLIDATYFSSLDQKGRERLLFETIEKYAKFRSRNEEIQARQILS